MNNSSATRVIDGSRIRISWIDIAFTLDMYLLAFIDSRTFYIIPNSQTTVLSIALALNITSFLACFWTNRSAFWGMAATLITSFFFLFIFSRNFSTPLSGRTLAGYVSLFSIGIFGNYAHFHGLSRAMRLLFIASSAYLVTFIYLHFSIGSIAHQQLLSSSGSGSVLLQSHSTIQSLGGNVSYRVYTSGIFLSIGMLYALESLKQRFSWVWLTAFTSFSCAFLISDFRYQLAAAILTAILALLPIATSTKIRLSATFVGCVMVAILFCALLSFNPYDLVRGDITGAVRANEAQLAIETFHKYSIFGTGLYSETDQLIRVYGNSFMALSDLGFLGELVQFGIAGYALLFVSNMFVHSFAIRAQEARQIDPAARRTLADLCIFLGLMQPLSPYLWEVGGAIMLALSIGYLKRYSGNKRIHQRAGRRASLPNPRMAARIAP